MPGQVSAQVVDRTLGEMADVAASLDDAIKRNRKLVLGMQEYEALLQARVLGTIDQAEGQANAILNKQLETLMLNAGADLAQAKNFVGISNSLKKGHKVYTLLKDFDSDLEKGGLTQAVGGAAVNVLTGVPADEKIKAFAEQQFKKVQSGQIKRTGLNFVQKNNPFGLMLKNARTIRKLTELSVTSIDILFQKDVLEEYSAEVRNAELRNLEFAQNAAMDIRAIRAAMEKLAVGQFDAWGLKLREVAVIRPAGLAKLKEELDAARKAVDKAVAIGGLMAPLGQKVRPILTTAEDAYEKVERATKAFQPLPPRMGAVSLIANELRLRIGREDSDLRDQLDRALEQMNTVAFGIEQEAGVPPVISEQQVDFLESPRIKGIPDLAVAIEAVEALIRSIPSTVAQRETRRINALGKTITVGVSISIRHKVMSADPLTERVTGNLMRANLSPLLRLQQDQRRDCDFRVKVNDEFVTRTRSQRVFTTAKFVGADPTYSGNRSSTIQGPGLLTMIIGNGRVGRDTIVASVPGVTEVNQNADPPGCGDFVPVQGTLTAEDTVEFHKVTDISYAAFSSAAGERELTDFNRLDTFFADEGADVSVSRNAITFGVDRIELTTPDGVRDQRNPGNLLDFRGSGPFFRDANSGGVKLVNTGEIGSGRYTLFVPDRLGNPNFARDVELSSNRVFMDVESIPGGDDFIEPMVDLIGQNEIRFVVEGPANLTGYKVRFEVGGDVAVTRPLASFRRVGGVNVATTSLSAPDIPAAAGQLKRVVATLLSPDGVALGRGDIEVRAVVVGNNLRIVAKGTNVGIAARDLFVPRQRNDFGAFEVQVKTPKGPDVQAPLSHFSARMLGNGFLLLDGDTVKASFSTNNGGADASTRDAGNYLLRVEAPEADPNGGGRYVFVDGRGDTDSATLTVNVLNVAAREEGGRPQTVLQVFGPAPMANYRARFQLRAGQGTVELPFTRGETGSEAVLDAPSRDVLVAQVVTSGGQVVGEFRLGSDGPALGPPQFTFRIPASAAPGDAVVVFANVVNVPFDDAGDFDCKWTVDPAVGRFDAARVTLAPVTGNAGLCVNTLRIADDPANVGRTLPIEVELVRVVGEVANADAGDAAGGNQ